MSANPTRIDVEVVRSLDGYRLTSASDVGTTWIFKNMVRYHYPTSDYRATVMISAEGLNDVLNLMKQDKLNVEVFG